ncbi:MAG TPA: hypothetical protein VGG18_12125, partial [Granulicella sp.]
MLQSAIQILWCALRQDLQFVRASIIACANKPAGLSVLSEVEWTHDIKPSCSGRDDNSGERAKTTVVRERTYRFTI